MIVMAVVEPGDNIQHAIDVVGKSGFVLCMQGTYPVTKTIETKGALVVGQNGEGSFKIGYAYDVNVKRLPQ